MLQWYNHQIYGPIKPLYKFNFSCDGMLWMGNKLYLLTTNTCYLPLIISVTYPSSPLLLTPNDHSYSPTIASVTYPL